MPYLYATLQLCSSVAALQPCSIQQFGQLSAWHTTKSCSRRAYGKHHRHVLQESKSALKAAPCPVRDNIDRYEASLDCATCCVEVFTVVFLQCSPCSCYT